MEIIFGYAKTKAVFFYIPKSTYLSNGRKKVIILFVYSRNIVIFASEMKLHCYFFVELKTGGMGTMKVRAVIELLEKNGWKYIRTNGDHHIYYKKGARRPIVIPGKDSDDLKDGTLGSILREAGLK